jgi:hypothetical protein
MAGGGAAVAGEETNDTVAEAEAAAGCAPGAVTSCGGRKVVTPARLEAADTAEVDSDALRPIDNSDAARGSMATADGATTAGVGTGSG